jgi:hypothetical protein
MRPDDETSIGGPAQRFLTTQWSVIGQIQAGADRNRALIGLLLGRYWKPVYCYLRRRGYANEQAKDLTQGFFHEVVLNRDLVQRADPAKGRFRAFLLHALNQYLANETKKSHARRRVPPGGLVPLEVTASSNLPAALQQSDPEATYNYAWMTALLDQILAAVRKDCESRGLDVHWQLFQERIVRPILDNSPPTPLGDLCERYTVATPQQVSNMIATVKRRFRSTMRDFVRTTVLSEDEVDEELAEITRFFPKAAQDSG